MVVAEEGASRQAAALLPVGDVRVGVRVDSEQVEPAVVVVVEPAEAAAHHRLGVRGHAEAEGALAEVQAPLLRDVLQPYPSEAGRHGARGGRADGRRRGRVGGDDGRRHELLAACGTRARNHVLTGLIRRELESLAEPDSACDMCRGEGRRVERGDLRRSLEVGDCQWRALALPQLEMHAQLLDPVGRHGDRLPDRSAKPLLQTGKPPARRTIRREGCIATP